MTVAQLTITLPDGTWIKDVSTQFPEATFTVLAALPGADAGFGLVQVVSEDLPEILVAMDDHPVMRSIELLQANEHWMLVQFETTAPLLLRSAEHSRMPMQLPMEIVDGTTTVELTAARPNLSELTEQLEQRGIDFQVDQVTDDASGEEWLLSEKQLDLMLTAVEHGYYDTPRRCSLTELAEAVGISKSTCSETLHRAEEAIVKRFVEELPATRQSDES